MTKILTITSLGRADLWCRAIEGEIATFDILCPAWESCGCDRTHTGLNSHKASTTLMVRDVDLSFADVVAAFTGYLKDDESGWAFDDPAKEATAMARHNVEAAADYPHGTVLLPRYVGATWFYDELVPSC